MGIQDEVIDWMADGRLDRLERQARSGYASPEQMLKLIAEVRRLSTDGLSTRTIRNEGFIGVPYEQWQQVQAVLDAAKEWRAQFAKPSAVKLPRQGALIEAVDALDA